MLKILILLFIMAPAFAAEAPFNDNILFAFEKCKTLSVDIKVGTLTEAVVEPFDLHCRVKNDPMEYNCEFFDPGSTKKLALETLRGGKDKNNVGTLRNVGGSIIRLNLEKNMAQFETSVLNDGGNIYGRKMCVGIYLFEKDAVKKKP